MKLPIEVIDRLLGDKDFISSLTQLVKSTTGLVNWTLVVLVTTGVYRLILEIGSWFK
jgi:hypothetical protein